MSDVAEPSRREKGKHNRRERLLHASRILFAEHGINATTVEDIVAAAGVSRTTFFNYFGSKESLAATLHIRRMDAFSGLVDKLLERDLTTSDRVRFLFSDVARAEEAERSMLRAEIEILDRDGAPLEIRKERNHRFDEEILRILRQGRKQREVREDYPVYFLARIVAGIYRACIREWKYDPKFDVPEEFTQAGHFAAQSITLPPDSTPEKNNQ